MRVRAKFVLQDVTEHLNYHGTKSKANLKTLRFTAVAANFGDTEEERADSKEFWEASPSGEIKLGTINPEAAAAFEIGKAYYVDFTPAPE